MSVLYALLPWFAILNLPALDVMWFDFKLHSKITLDRQFEIKSTAWINLGISDSQNVIDFAALR